MELEFPDKYYRLKQIKTKLLSECTKCGHTGFIDTKECKCFKKFQLYVEYSYNGIDEEYWDVTFDKFESDQVAKEDVVKYCDNLDNARQLGLGIIFHGENGTGKSMLANLILIAAKKKKYTVYFTTFEQLLTTIKNTFDHSSNNEYYKKHLEKIKNVDFLCLDELGAEYRTRDLESFSVAQLSSLSKFRRRNNLCTIVTTNLDENDFNKIYGKTINSLFSGCSKFIKVNGTDWRSKQSKDWDKNLVKGQ